jgi:hypothetical protein
LPQAIGHRYDQSAIGSCNLGISPRWGAARVEDSSGAESGAFNLNNPWTAIAAMGARSSLWRGGTARIMNFFKVCDRNSIAYLLAISGKNTYFSFKNRELLGSCFLGKNLRVHLY